MIVKYNEEMLSRIIEDIFLLTGISISILDINYKPIAATRCMQKHCIFLQSSNKEWQLCVESDEKILERCKKSKKLEGHICRAGLYDSAMPIVKDDTIVGYVVMGQIRSDDSPSVCDYRPDSATDTIDDLCRLYSKTPFISKNRLEALYDLLPRILFDSGVHIVYDSLVSDVTTYIDENLCADLRLESLCSKFFVSKNRLYEAFRNNLGNTVTGYINERRIFHAKKLLKQSDESAGVIAEKVGIDNYTYFCKLFKKLCGQTPKEYRQRN